MIEYLVECSHWIRQSGRALGNAVTAHSKPSCAAIASVVSPDGSHGQISEYGLGAGKVLFHANLGEPTYARIAPEGADNYLGDVEDGLRLPVGYPPGMRRYERVRVGPVDCDRLSLARCQLNYVVASPSGYVLADSDGMRAHIFGPALKLLYNRVERLTVQRAWTGGDRGKRVLRQVCEFD